MNKKFLISCGFMLFLVGCAAKGPSEELQMSNACYTSTVNGKVEKYSDVFIAEDLNDLKLAVKRHYLDVSYAMLLRQRAHDISDPLGGIPATFELDQAQEKAISSIKPIYVILNRNSVPQYVSTAVQQAIKDGLLICYGS
ncbi:hypothetical protein ACEO96_18840 [Vibrio anguillarum]|uniref:hypothetical protein n=1 Tax=Vibrio anguillarum TaxID=55601 RepID=UPI002FE43430|nr:hypothetical protein [Vibrio vulnificus]